MIYTDEYNIAYQYLKDKYGYKRVCHTAKFSERLRNASNWRAKENLLAGATDDDFVIALNPIPDDDIEGKTIKIDVGPILLWLQR